MLTFEKLSQRPHRFKNLTGVSLSEFEQLSTAFEPAWEGARQAWLRRAGRQRAYGGGRPYALSQRTQLVMVLVWLGLYLTTDALGVLFEPAKSHVSRNSRRLLPVLRHASQAEFGGPEPPAKGQGKGLDQGLKS